HMTVAMMDGNCAPPAYAFDDGTLSMTMQCTSMGVDGGPRAETAFESTTTYGGPDRVTVKHRRVDRNHIVFDGVSTYHDTMTRIGDCEPGQKPGDRIRIDSRMNGSEIQKSMRQDNIFDASRTHHKLMEDILAAHRRADAAGLCSERWHGAQQGRDPAIVPIGERARTQGCGRGRSRRMGA